MPSWFSGMLLATCAAMLMVIAAARKAQSDAAAKDWRLLSWIFAYLSLDEVASIHEIPIRDLMVRWFHPSGVFVFAWVVAAIPLLALFLLRFQGFLRRLEPATRARFLWAGSVYVTGAVGMEMAEGFYFTMFGVDAGFSVLTAVEELLEMSGLLLFVRALLGYLQNIRVRVEFHIQS